MHRLSDGIIDDLHNDGNPLIIRSFIFMLSACEIWTKAGNRATLRMEADASSARTRCLLIEFNLGFANG